MDSLYILVPVAIIFLGLAIWFFLWAVNAGQYDDLDREADRILFEDEHSNVPDDKHTGS